ncbi:MAG: Hpt domain-containing protein [Spirochaetaceae bacterium]|nr:Hpt domain-containing protein [Spirochaetaceae bacterium]HPG24188.1 Hpt domain-containing protein [Myxococcota bacterium]
MGLDMAKYRRIFLEESTEHLGEISRALLDLEKEMASVAAIDTIFRMAHSIKSMAASLGYDPVAELSHRLEDRMEGVRAAGRVRDVEELGLLFRGLEALEAMVAAVSEDQPLAPVDPGLIEELGRPAGAGAERDTAMAVGGEPKKVRTQSPSPR